MTFAMLLTDILFSKMVQASMRSQSLATCGTLLSVFLRKRCGRSACPSRSDQVFEDNPNRNAHLCTSTGAGIRTQPITVLRALCWPRHDRSSWQHTSVALVKDQYVCQQPPQLPIPCLEGMDTMSESSTARVSQDSLYYDIEEKEILQRDVYGSDQIRLTYGSRTSPETLRTAQPPNLLAESVRALGHDVRFLCTIWNSQQERSLKS